MRPVHYEKCTCKCTKVKSLVGDASIATVRKQDRYLFDFSFTLEFIISVEDSSGGGGSDWEVGQVVGIITRRELMADFSADLF